MMIRYLAVAAACLFAGAPLVFSSSPATNITTHSVRLTFVVPEHDTASHVDVQTSHAVRLSATAIDSVGNVIPGRVVRWSSGNASTAKVSATGVVTGVARGYATITATVDGVKAATRVCVTSSAREEIPFAIEGVQMTTARELRALRRGDTTRATAHLQEHATGATQWGQCVHWRLDEATARVASIDRMGVVSTSEGNVPLIIHAYLGPSVP